MRDLERGAFDVLIFTELSRISRSVHDFLGLTDLFQKHGVEFISLRENFDTTSPAGRLMMTVLTALAQFECEQIGERVRAGMRARAERGLYNGGGQVYGYDLDPERKGYLFVNEQEAQVVKEMFALYLELSSIAEVVNELNQRGYRTKEYTTRQGKFKLAKPFVWGTIRNMLHNPLYIGMKGINVKNRGLDQDTLAEDERYRLVEAVWEPLINTDTFSQVQKLIEDKYKSNRNKTSTVTHDYILSGLLWCPHCEVFLEGGSSKKQRYHYYRHPQKTKREGCGPGSVRAEAFERLVVGQLKILSEDEDLMADVVTKANETSQAQLPELEHKLSLLISQRDGREIGSGSTLSVCQPLLCKNEWHG